MSRRELEQLRRIKTRCEVACEKTNDPDIKQVLRYCLEGSLHGTTPREGNAVRLLKRLERSNYDMWGVKINDTNSEENTDED